MKKYQIKYVTIGFDVLTEIVSAYSKEDALGRISYVSIYWINELK